MFNLNTGLNKSLSYRSQEKSYCGGDENKLELKKVRVILEGTGYKRENGEIVLLATKPTKTISVEIIQNSKDEMEK